MGRKGKTLWTENGNGEKLMCYEADSEFDEAAHVAAVIGQNVKKGAKLRDHAILYRMNAQSGPIETYFARAGIPYKIVGGQRFYDRKEIKDILAYMSIVANERTICGCGASSIHPPAASAMRASSVCRRWPPSRACR